MISIEQVTFGYRKQERVLDNFSLTFDEGGVYGLLGKNGTGKSTLLYLMMGLLKPWSGSVLIDGMNPFKRQPELMGDMFIVPEEYNLPRISLQDYVRVFRSFYPRFSTELLRTCLEGFELDMNLNLGALSMGQKKKTYISMALATNTRYLFMDEPTNGMDILSKSAFRKALISGMGEDKTILISTHMVHDVERLLDHVTILDRNRVLLSQQIVEQDKAFNLEQLFIDTVSGKRAE